MPGIAYVISSFRPLIGGAERATETLARGVQLSGHDVQVITRYHAGLPRFEEVSGVPVVRLGGNGSRPGGAFSFLFAAFLHLARLGKEWPIVHVQNLDAPLIVGYMARSLLRKSLVITVHAQTDITLRKQAGLGWTWVSLMPHLGDYFVALTPAIYEKYVDESVPPTQIMQIPNAIDTRCYVPVPREERRALRLRVGLEPDRPTLIFVGRLVDLKQVDVLLRAFAGLTVPAQLLLVGDGTERPNLERLARELGISTKVRFVGAVQETVSYYQMADVFVLPSRYEGLSMALLEAMACGVVPLVSDVPGNRALIEPGRTGHLFPPGDSGTLSRMLQYILQAEEKRLEVGEQARAFVEATCDVSIVARRHLDVYHSLLDKTV